jgi:hypothetical protein
MILPETRVSAMITTHLSASQQIFFARSKGIPTPPVVARDLSYPEVLNGQLERNNIVVT